MSQNDNSLPQAINLSNRLTHSMESLGTPQQIQMAIRPLQDEIAQLREERELERQEVAALHAKLTFLESLQEQDINRICLDIALDRKRIAKLEKSDSGKHRTGAKQVARLARVEALLITRQNEPMTFSEIGKFLELGHRDGKKNTRKQNMTHLGKAIGQDDRFRVFDSNTQKGSKMVCLRQDYFGGSMR